LQTRNANSSYSQHEPDLGVVNREFRLEARGRPEQKVDVVKLVGPGQASDNWVHHPTTNLVEVRAAIEIKGHPSIVSGFGEAAQPLSVRAQDPHTERPGS